MAKIKQIVILFMIYFCQAVNSASILALFSSLSFSDHLVFRGYVSRLVQNGHHVVMMTPYPGRFAYPDVEKIVELDVGQESAPYWEEYKKLMTNVDDYHSKRREIHELYIKLAIAQLKSKPMTALFINPNIKFDLVITEADVPILYAVAEKYRAPHIAFTTSNGKIHQYEAKGCPVHPILYPDVNALSYRNASTLEKLSEVKRHLQTKYEYYYNYLPLCEVAAKKLLGLQRDLQEVEDEIDLLMIAANPLVIGARPTGPAVVYTDLLHVRPGLALPPALKEVLDSSTKGVVYFSVGALQESQELAPQLLKILTDAFKELPFTVLWKIGNITAINKPDNVIAEPWFPQQEVLAHPNVKVFITHGGPRSLEEALFYEVPIVGIPLVKSRRVFIGEYTRHGVGEILDPYYLEKKSLKDTILNVANNENYKIAMQKLRAKIVDPIISGPDNAVWWTNHVLRHSGARHLRSPAVGISTTKYYMLDTLIFFALVLAFNIWLSVIVLRYVYKTLRARFFWRKAASGAGGKFKAL